MTNVIKGGYTQELGVLHDVYLQVWMWDILEHDSLHLCAHLFWQTFWDIAASLRLICWYMQTNISTSVLLRRFKKKKNPALISDIKPDSRGKFHLSEKMLWLWTPGFCSFPAGSLQYCEAKRTSLLQAKRLELLLHVACWGRGARQSFILARLLLACQKRHK